jgi:carbonic anhydrase
MLDKTPEGDLFMIRNIGNQLTTAKGSVQYGVNHLNSSLLLFIGHSACGAIKAAKSDYSALESDIKRELDTITIAKEGEVIEGVKANVNSQVTDALKEFSDKVKHGQLLIVGAVYDFSDDMKLGAGKLNIINMNGETDVAKFNVPAAEEKQGHEHEH